MQQNQPKKEKIREEQELFNIQEIEEQDVNEVERQILINNMLVLWQQMQQQMQEIEELNEFLCDSINFNAQIMDIMKKANRNFSILRDMS